MNKVMLMGRQLYETGRKQCLYHGRGSGRPGVCGKQSSFRNCDNSLTMKKEI